MIDIGGLTDERFNQYGDTHVAAGWSDRASQVLRLEKIVDFLHYQTGDEVLDLGGGSGAMLSELSERFDIDDTQYICMDVSKEARLVFNEKFPQANYILENFYSCRLEKKVDWIVCSGALNYNLSEDNISKLTHFIKKFFELARKGVIFNFIHDAVDYKDDALCYYPLDKVVEICMQNTRFIRVNSDYCLFEATVALYKK